MLFLFPINSTLNYLTFMGYLLDGKKMVLISLFSLWVLKSVLYLHSLYANGLVVQLVRIHACHAWGRGFESRPDRKIAKKAPRSWGFFLRQTLVVLF